MFEKIRAWNERRRRRKVLQATRDTMALFGYDTSRISDDDLEAAWLVFVKHQVEALTELLISANHALQSIEKLGHSVAKFDAALREANI